jgi:predicted lipid-binding transport protein (Tim44 family)
LGWYVYFISTYEQPKLIINTINIKNMNIKRVFGGLLTILGIGSLIYTAVVFINTSGGKHDIKSLVIFGILGFVFFSAGIKLVSSVKDEA